jgi:hypothetical protein
MTNPGLQKPLAFAGLELAHEVASAESRGQDPATWQKLFYGRTSAGDDSSAPSTDSFAARIGASPDRASAYVKTLANAGLIEKRVTRVRADDGRPVSRVEWRPSMTAAEMMARLATLDQSQIVDDNGRQPGKWGGKRPRRLECPDHPEAEIIARILYTCAECGQVVAPADERTLTQEEREGLAGAVLLDAPKADPGDRPVTAAEMSSCNARGTLPRVPSEDGSSPSALTLMADDPGALNSRGADPGDDPPTPPSPPPWRQARCRFCHEPLPPGRLYEHAECVP